MLLLLLLLFHLNLSRSEPAEDVHLHLYLPPESNQGIASLYSLEIQLDCQGKSQVLERQRRQTNKVTEEKQPHKFVCDMQTKKHLCVAANSMHVTIFTCQSIPTRPCPSGCRPTCPRILLPVCGSDKTTYDNKCLLEKVSIRLFFRSNNILFWKLYF